MDVIAPLPEQVAAKVREVAPPLADALDRTNGYQPYDDAVTSGMSTWQRFGESRRALIRHGDRKGEYHNNPHRMYMGIVGAAVMAGVSVRSFLALAEDKKNRGLRWFQNRSDRRAAERDTERFFDSTYATFQDEIDRVRQVRTAICDVIALSATLGWTKYLTPVSEKVWLAHLLTAHRAGSLRYKASLRHIADTAEVSPSTVYRHQRRLLEFGLIRQDHPDWNKGTAAWTIVENVAEVLSGSLIACSPRSEINDLPAYLASLSAAFRHGSGVSRPTWLKLSPDVPFSADDLVNLTGFTKATVRTQLCALERHGLAICTEDGWLRIGHRKQLEHVATTTGAAEASQRQRERHERERQHQRQLRQQYREAHAATQHTDDKDVNND